MRQCLSSDGPEYRCVFQEDHSGWHGDGKTTIWVNDEPGLQPRLTPAEAKGLESERRLLYVSEAKVTWTFPVRHEAVKTVLPRREVRKIPVLSESDRKIRELLGELWPCVGEPPEAHPGRWRDVELDKDCRSHHEAHPGCWLLQGYGKLPLHEYDEEIEVIHGELEAAGIL